MISRRNFLIKAVALALTPSVALLPTHADDYIDKWDLGSGDFTVSFWMKPPGGEWCHVTQQGNKCFVNGILSSIERDCFIDEVFIRATDLAKEERTI